MPLRPQFHVIIMSDEKPAIDWSLPFPDILRGWMAHHGRKRRQAADCLRVPVETLDGWLYGKNNCAYPDSFTLLMQHVPAKRRGAKAWRVKAPKKSAV